MRRQFFKVAGLVALAALSLVYLVRPGIAADKGGPPLKIDSNGDVKVKNWTGCFVDAGAAGLFIDGMETVKAFSIGAGCDYQIDSRIVIGAGGSYMVGQNDARAIDTYVRAGMLLNPDLLLYARGGFMLDGRSPNVSDSVGTIGFGLETSISSKATIGVEAHTNFKEWGDFSGMPDAWTGRAFARFKF